MSHTPEIQTAETTKPKHTRRSRRSLVWQISECHMKIDRELEAGTERPARLTLLKAKLESLMTLLQREDRAKEKELPVKVEDVSAHPQTEKTDPLDDVVAEMLRRHASPPVVKLETPRPIPAPQPVPTIEKDPDLLI